jgi:feruloyl-CoA synthase
MNRSNLASVEMASPQPVKPKAKTGRSKSAAVDFAPAEVIVKTTPEGGYLLSSPMPLQPYEKNLGVMLRYWARKTPERVFLGERAADGQWRLLTYGEAGRHASAVAQALIDRDLGPKRPIMILSGNSINHALLMLGGFLAGVPVAPVSVAYSLLSQDLAKLKFLFEEVAPALVYAENGEMFGRAIGTLELSGVEVVTGSGQVPGVSVTPFSHLLETPPTKQVEKAFAAVGAGSIAKFLFSSGSTGMPKGVINTHGMLCANQQMLAQVWPFTSKIPPVLVDWLPWNHTFGGNHNFNLVLKHGGTLYIDGGKPVPGLVEQTVKNLAEISPTIYFNVPAGYSMLLPYLERDEGLRHNFFRRLTLIFYAGAALPQDLWQRLEKVALQTTGRKVLMTSSWGSTETAPLATASHFPLEKAGVIGLPCPGVTLKMVPNGEKFELRVKGPNVTPGYLRRPDLTVAAFDEEGFYKIGDAGKFDDPENPSKGIVFDGRVAEDFKLNTGTWVHVGMLRLAVLTGAAPLLQDALVAGQDRNDIGILAWPNIQACRELTGSADTVPAAELVRSRKVIAHLRQALTEHNVRQQGSATRVRRLLLMTEPPSIDANEITDKGYINQRASLEKRKDLVKLLYAENPGAEVILL